MNGLILQDHYLVIAKTVPEIFMKHFDLVIPHVLFVAKLYVVTFLNFVLNFIVPIYFIHKMKVKLALLIGLFVFIIFSFFYTKQEYR
ncbi:MAG: hypothetical protein IPL21_03370 [Saprospirales bacterium]|nr:hypothetical protein [Saprospirales bacterium]